MADELLYSELQKSKVSSSPANLATLTARPPTTMNRLYRTESRGDSYCMAVWFAALTGLGHVFIGAVLISIMLYYFLTRDCHAIFYAIASNRSRARFAGPFKTRVIDNVGDTYSKTVACAIGIGISHVFIGAVVMSISIYSFHKEDFHGALFSMAYHFFSAEAILTLSYINGWSTPMRWKHRKCVHIFLQLCAITCALIGTGIVVVTRGHTRTTHGISGLATLVLTGVNVVTGPFTLKGIRKAHLSHMLLGILCFSASTLCLCSGLAKEEFKRWAGRTVVTILTGFVIFYSSLIIVTTFIKCMKKI